MAIGDRPSLKFTSRYVVALMHLFQAAQYESPSGRGIISRSFDLKTGTASLRYCMMPNNNLLCTSAWSSRALLLKIFAMQAIAIVAVNTS